MLLGMIAVIAYAECLHKLVLEECGARTPGTLDVFAAPLGFVIKDCVAFGLPTQLGNARFAGTHSRSEWV